MDFDSQIKSQIPMRPMSSIRPFTAKINKYHESDKENLSKNSEIEEALKFDEDENNNENQIDFFKYQTKKLDKIELLEKNADDLYNWRALFTNNSFRPKTTKTKKSARDFKNTLISEKSNTKETQENNSKNDEKESFVFPLALIDKEEEKLKDFITIQSIRKRKKRINRANVVSAKQSKNFSKTISNFSLKSNNKDTINTYNSKSNLKINYNNANCSRPQSVYSHRKDNAVFYTNKAVNEYFTQDFKEFTQKFKPLQAKFSVNSETIKKALEIEKNKTKTIINYKKPKIEKIFDDRELKITLTSGKIEPLIKSIANYTDNERWNQFLVHDYNKTYLNSSKPLGFWNSKVDYKVNIRNKLMIELKENLLNKNLYEKKINTDTYDENDPDIKILLENKNMASEEGKSEKNISEMNFLTEHHPKISIEEKLLKEKNAPIIKIKKEDQSKSSFLQQFEAEISDYKIILPLKDNNSFNKLQNEICNKVVKNNELTDRSKVSQVLNTKEQTKSSNYYISTTKESLQNKKKSTNYQSTFSSSFNKTARPNTSHLKGLIKVDNISNVMRTSLSPRTDIKSASRPKSGNVMKSSKRTVQKKKSFKNVFLEKMRPITAKIFTNNELSSLNTLTISKGNIDADQEILVDDNNDKLKSTKINNFYFNDFIDLKFRPMNQNFGRYLNSYKKEDLNNLYKAKESENKFVSKKKAVLSKKEKFSDLIQIENYKNHTLESKKNSNKIKPKSAVSKGVGTINILN